MNQNRTVLLVFAVVAIVVLVVASLLTTTYTVKGRAVFMAGNEYILIRSVDGNLISAFKDNVRNTVTNYDVTEFQRGDVVSFRLNEALISRRYVSQGDTLGYIISNEELRNLLDLKGQYDVMKAELEYFTTGQKPEDVLLAHEAWELAKQELSTQQKLMARSASLFRDSVISAQEFEIKENNLKVKEMGVKIAHANYLSVTTGEKPEQELLVRARMEALGAQIQQIESRISYFTLTAPFGGRLNFPRNPLDAGTILTVSDTTRLVGVVPMLSSEYRYVSPGLRISFLDQEGRVESIDDMVRMVDNRQAFFVTAVWPYCPDMRFGSIMEVKVQCDTVSWLGYVARRFINQSNGRS